jgi:hypothetical protein
MELGSPNTHKETLSNSPNKTASETTLISILLPATCLQDQGGDTPATAHFHSALPKSENYGALKA